MISGKKLVRSASSEIMQILIADSDQEVRDGGDENDSRKKMDNCDGVDDRDKEFDNRDKEVDVAGDNLGDADDNLPDDASHKLDDVSQKLDNKDKARVCHSHSLIGPPGPIVSFHLKNQKKLSRGVLQIHIPQGNYSYLRLLYLFFCRKSWPFEDVAHTKICSICTQACLVCRIPSTGALYD